jgi:phage-related protein
MPTYEINTYDLRWMNNKDKLERALIDWLMTGDGSYKVLEDKTKPGYFTYAVCTEIGEISTNHLDGYLATSINFNRQPFWFSHAGQKAIEWSGNTQQDIVNPEPYTALPIITISGSGYMILTVNGVDYNIRLTEAIPTITLDCEKMHAYCGSTDADSYISSDYFPSLRTGTNHIRVWTNQGATIGACSLIPRWRRL